MISDVNTGPRNNELGQTKKIDSFWSAHASLLGSASLFFFVNENFPYDFQFDKIISHILVPFGHNNRKKERKYVNNAPSEKYGSQSF